MKEVHLWCPYCDTRHIDEGKWATFDHEPHLCLPVQGGCGRTFPTTLGKSVAVAEDGKGRPWERAAPQRNLDGGAK